MAKLGGGGEVVAKKWQVAPSWSKVIFWVCACMLASVYSALAGKVARAGGGWWQSWPRCDSAGGKGGDL